MSSPHAHEDIEAGGVSQRLEFEEFEIAMLLSHDDGGKSFPDKREDRGGLIDWRVVPLRDAKHHTSQKVWRF
jgi:hypothetical protein